MEIHELFQIPIGDITFEHIQRFCARQHREYILIEYKRDFSSNDEQHQIAKIIAAFANTQGGIVIWGVEPNPQNKDYPCINPQGQRLGKHAYKKIADACARRIKPSITPEITDFRPNLANQELGFVVARVPLGDLVPYTVDNVIYERVADSSEPRAATIEVITTLLRRRENLEDDGRNRRERMKERVKRAALTSSQSIGYPKMLDELASPPLGMWLSGGPRFQRRQPQAFSRLVHQVEQASKMANFQPAGFFSERFKIPVGEGIQWRTWPKGDNEQLVVSVDVYGNVVLFDDSMIGTAEFSNPQLAETLCVRQRLMTGTEWYCVRGAKLAKLLNHGTRFIRDLNENMGWESGLVFQTDFYGTRNMALTFDSERKDPNVWASCPYDNQISVVTGVSLPENAFESAQELFFKLQWAWGNQNPRPLA